MSDKDDKNNIEINSAKEMLSKMSKRAGLQNIDINQDLENLFGSIDLTPVKSEVKSSQSSVELDLDFGAGFENLDLSSTQKESEPHVENSLFDSLNNDLLSTNKVSADLNKSNEVAEVVSDLDLEIVPVLQEKQKLENVFLQEKSSDENDDDLLKKDVDISGVEDEIEESLLPVFAEEAVDLIPQIAEVMRSLKQNPDDVNAIKKLHRDLHTIKGSARMVGALKVGAIIHHMESQMEAAENGRLEVRLVLDSLENNFDKASNLIDKVLNNETDAVEEKRVDTKVQKEDRSVAQKTVRVNTDVIDRLVNESGEVRLSGAAIGGGLTTIKRLLKEMGENAKRMSKFLRELEIQTESQMASRIEAAKSMDSEFDPLEFDRFSKAQELSRFLAEGMHDIIDVQLNVEKMLVDHEAVLIHQDQMASDIQQTLMSVRLEPFGSIADRLYRVVRQSAKELEKQVELDIKGENIEIDRGVLNKIIAPLEHILRNGVAHGIEKPADRKLVGKLDRGSIKMIVTHLGSVVQIIVKDDGAGLNLQKVRQKGIEKGFITESDKVSDEKLKDLIFLPGFSTADSISQLAGRGVGMDVVKNEIIALGGQVEMKTETGKGITFTITLPVSLATMQAVIVEAANTVVAIPAEIIEEIMSIRVERLNEFYEKGRAYQSNGDNEYRFFYLPFLLGDQKNSPEPKTYNQVILLKSGDRSVAVHIDKLLGTREIVVKNIGRQVARINGLSGATVLGDGRLGLIANPVLLANREGIVVESSAGEEKVKTEYRSHRPTVMVVDDSLTVRKVTNKVLERAGYEVMLAKDGIDALEQLQNQIPDIILSDVEMPRMDGFELLKNLKADSRFKPVPVIVISSRTAEKHKNTGMSLGASVYLGKPYIEDELLGHIQELMKKNK